MLYHISSWCPTREMSGAGFLIQLFPKWKTAVKESGLNQKKIDIMIKKLGRIWLDGHGYSNLTDWDGEKRHLYRPEHLRIKWGEWGPEHISVPGNACGLDISDSIDAPPDGMVLGPHNVDLLSQASLLLTMFLKIADILNG